MLIRKLILLFVLLLNFSLVSAQDYKKLAFRIDSLANIGLAKSALVEVDKLDLLARKNKNAPQQIKAAIYRMTFQSFIEENSLVEIISRLKIDIKQASFPVKPVLQSILADMYWKYYQQNRWQFSQRTRLENDDSDFTQWDLRTIINETNKLYKLSLTNVKAEQNTPITVLDGVLTGDNQTRHLRPTLYDLLVNRAFDFYLAEEPGLAKPRLPFNLNDPRLFDDSKTFANLIIQTTDTASTFYQGIKYLQQATLFHLQKQNTDALADLDLKRLEFLYSKSDLIDKDSLYLKALQAIAKRFSSSVISADAIVLQAKYYQEKDILVKAVRYVKQVLSSFPESMGGKNASILLENIAQKRLSATIEDKNIPGKPLLALLNYRNLKRAYISIYRISEKQYAEKYRGYQITSDSMYHVIQNIKPVQTKQVQLPDPGDYREHRLEFKIDPLVAGIYILEVKDSLSQRTALSNFVSFKVTSLSYNIRPLPNGRNELRLMDRQTGSPIKNVSVNINHRNEVESAKVLTNDQGLCTYNLSSNQFDISLTYQGDTLTDKNKYVYQPYLRDEEPEEHTILFTDRQIYRPGQMIYFKGLQIETHSGKNRIVPQQDLRVDFNDANNETISALDLRTNEFGTVSGSFIIPQNILNGQFTLSTDDGSIQIKIEEYKRPTFSVDFSPVKESYKPNDSITVKGNVKAFSGYGLTQAKVTYRITRSSFRYPHRFTYSNNTSDEIKSDTIHTNEQGDFTIKFKAEALVDLADKNSYTFDIDADATDASGETHSAETSVRVGENNIVIDATIPKEVFTKGEIKIPVALHNLNGQALNGNIKVQVYALQNPKNLFKNRLWSKPDAFLMEKSLFQNDFPDYAFRDEDEAASYPVLEQITQIDLALNDTSKAIIDLKALRKKDTGIYKLVIQASNKKGDTTSITNYVNVVGNSAKVQNLNDWVIPVLTSGKPGEKAEFLLGINQKCHILMEQYEGPKIISSNWLTINEAQKRIYVPIPLDTSTNLAVQFMMVYQNRLYTSYQKIDVQQDNKLDIRFLTYRNKLQPGQKEQWKLQIKGAEKHGAEMVASLYDASLDNISPAQSWINKIPNQINYQQYYAWSKYDFIQGENTQLLNYTYYGYALIQRSYERLNLADYNYYGGYNYSYHQYLQRAQQRMGTARNDEKLQADYLKNAALIKNGFIISGQLIDAKDGSILLGVSISIKGTSISTLSNSQGNFKMKVPVKGILVFSAIGYKSKEISVAKTATIKVKLEPDGAYLNEVVVMGYGTQRKKDLTGAVSVIQDNSIKDFASIGELGIPGSAKEIRIRGLSTYAPGKEPLYIIDGVLMEGDIKSLNPTDILEMNLLNSVQASALYGARAANGAIIITTKKGKAALMAQQPVIRKNFKETAFFYPQLRTNEKGEILVEFTIPETLTQWRFKGFAHTPDLKSGYIESQVLTQKQLSISVNMPRFLREGDTISVSARLANLTTSALQGKVHLQLFNALNMKPVNLFVKQSDDQQDFNVNASANKAVTFKLVIPSGLDALTYRLTADAGTFSDGEENTLPVLPNRTLVTESMPMMVRSGQTRTYNFDKLVNQTSTTLQNKTLTLEYTQNPAWYAVQALPYMMEFPYECSEQIFSRYYANSLATNLVNKMPIVKQVFDRWKSTNSPELLSNLEKNQELKSILIEETPWLKDAVSESEQKKRIALLFDLNKMSNELALNLDKLQKKQLSDGGFPWFGSNLSDQYITQHIIEGIGKLNHLQIKAKDTTLLHSISDNALSYLDKTLIEDSSNEKKSNSKLNEEHLSAIEIHAWFARSYYPERPITKELKIVLDNFIKRSVTAWKFHSIYEQGMIALTLHRNNKADIAQMIVRSLLERAQSSDEMGMYWAKNQLGYFWYQSPVETQCLLIELFTESGNNIKAVEEMKIWLLRNKQTNNWQTTKATAAACYALLMKGSEWLADQGTSLIEVNKQALEQIKPDIKTEAGTGYLKTTWVDKQIKPELGKVSINNQGKTISWGAMHWQYLENLDKISSSKTDIELERKYFNQKQTDNGPVLTAIDASHQPKIGDLLKVVVYLKAGRDYEYVQLKDMRPAGTEPVDALSLYKYQDGLYYYQVTKDVATNFFISYLKKGNYVFEYSLRVAQPGNFSTGISTVQSMYAPEFNAHSEGSRMIIKSE